MNLRALHSEPKVPSDNDLMRDFKKGDAGAFEELYRRHRSPMYGFCLRMAGSKELAADAMQDVFIKIVRSSARWTPEAKFTTWAYTIARNHLHDLARRKRPIVELKEEPTHEPPLCDPQLRDLLNHAIGSLSREQREVFLLRSYAEMSFREIADVIDIPINTAKSRMRRAVDHLRDALEAAGVGPEAS